MLDRKQEDQAITKLVNKYGIKKWSLISEKMETECGLKPRSGKQCRERWHNHLDPSINKKPWTAEEELTMFEAHKKHANKWADIAKLLPGRYYNLYQNR